MTFAVRWCMVYTLTYKITRELEKDRANNLRPKEVAEETP